MTKYVDREPGLDLEAHVLGLGLEAQVLGPDLDMLRRP